MPHILVIDDDELVREIVRDTLLDAGHTVSEAENGTEGIRTLLSQSPALVITDIVMPEMEGIELIVAIQEADRRIPIIVISGGGRGVDKGLFLEVAREMDVQGVLAKPFAPDELLEAVDQALMSTDDTSYRAPTP